MKRLMILFITMFLISTVNIAMAQWERNDDSYKIYFAWSNSRPTGGNVGGYVYEDGNNVTMIAVRTSRGFNLYAKNGQPDGETGAPVVDHSYFPSWYATYGWDTPDADPLWSSSAPFYLINLDTFGEKWTLVYTQYPNPPTDVATAWLAVPMSGSADNVMFNGDGTIDIDLKEDGGDWRIFWGEWYEDCKLDGPHLLLHLDLTTMTGYIVPKKLVE